MTYVELVKEVSRRSGWPPETVRQVLDTMVDVVKAHLIQQDEVAFRGLCKVYSTMSTVSVRGIDSRKSVKRIILRIRPVKAFRRELNSWKSSESS